MDYKQIFNIFSTHEINISSDVAFCGYNLLIPLVIFFGIKHIIAYFHFVIDIKIVEMIFLINYLKFLREQQFHNDLKDLFFYSLI